MILDTGRLFERLLQPFAIDVVCDIGSLNGADALRFRRCAPRAEITAYEANPDNYRAMAASQALRRAQINLSFCALAAAEGEATFYVVTPRGPEDLARRGMSSLYQRAHPAHRGAPVRVPARRLDGVLQADPAARIALWIDAEGAAYEVLEGAQGVLDHVLLVHVEVETTPWIGAQQKLRPDVTALLARHGLREVATDADPAREQFNALYVRTDLDASMAATLYRHRRALRRRWWLMATLLAWCPQRVRDYFERRRLIPAAVPD